VASPISITPTLSNKSSVKFNQELKKQENLKISQQNKDRITNLVKEVLAKNKKK